MGKCLRLFSILAVLTMVLLSAIPAAAEGEGPAVRTGKADYTPEETVDIYGRGFAAEVELVIQVVRPDGSIVKGDGSFTPGSDSIITDAEGGFTYYYILDGVIGEYAVNVLQGDTVLASTTFTDAPAAPSLVSPNDGITTTDNTVYLDWNTSSGAIRYQARVGTVNPPESPTWDSGTIALLTEATTPALANGTYYWQVRAGGITSWGSWSGTRSFKVNADSTPPDIPAMISPADGSTTDDDTPALSWGSVTDPSAPVEYEAVLFNSSDIQLFSTTNLLGQWTTSTQATVSVLGLALEDGTYHWRVKARDSIPNTSGWSAWAYFTINTDSTPPAIPAIISPADGSTTSDNTPTLSWGTVTDPSAPVEYEAMVLNSSDLPVFISGWTTSAGAAADFLGGPLEDGTYHWRVIARDSRQNTSGWSADAYFTVNTDSTPPDIPAIISPADGSTVDDNTPTLSWGAVTDPSAPVKYEAALFNRYGVQIFSTTNLIGQWTTSTEAAVGIFGELTYLTDATYHWRVRARDSASNTSGWSPWAYFIVETGRRQYTAAITPVISNPGETQNYAITLTNISSGTLYDIGSATIDIPAGWSVSGVAISDYPPDTEWTVSQENGTDGELRLQALDPDPLNNQLIAGDALTISFTGTAPAGYGIYTWTASAYDEPDYTEAFTLSGSQPEVRTVNDPPAGADDTVTTPEDTDYTFTAADFSFTDPDDNPENSLLAVKISTLPSEGTLKNGATTLNAGDSVPADDITAGNFIFSPTPNVNGSPCTSFIFQVQDNGGTALGGIDLDPTPKTLTIDVTPVNDAPAISPGTLESQTVVQCDPLIAGTIIASDIDSTSFSLTGLPKGAQATVTSVSGSGTLESPYTVTWSLRGIITDVPQDYPIDVSDGSLSTSTGVTITVIVPEMHIEETAGLENDADEDGIPGPGDTLQYLITLTNTGPGDAIRPRFTNAPDENTTLVAGSVILSQGGGVNSSTKGTKAQNPAPIPGTILKGNRAGDKTIEISFTRIPAGATVIVTFEVTLNSPLWSRLIINQATLTGSNFTPIVSDDPDTTQPDDPTIVNVMMSSPVHSPGLSTWGIVVLVILFAGIMVWVGRRPGFARPVSSR
jgi:uncharacterized repeat protein (TIGR01451 family)